MVREHIELTHQEEGCISFEVKQSLDPFIWEVQEVFDSMKSFKHHQSRTASSIWGVKTQIIIKYLMAINSYSFHNLPTLIRVFYPKYESCTNKQLILKTAKTED